jgi:hypothetical protein
MLEPRRFTTLWASTACYRLSFALLRASISFSIHHQSSIIPTYIVARDSVIKQSREKNSSQLQPIRALSECLFFIIVSGVRLSPLGTAATTGLLYQPQLIDDGDCGEIGGMKIGRGNRSTRRKPAPAPLCPPQIPHDQTRARTRAAAVGSQRVTA